MSDSTRLPSDIEKLIEEQLAELLPEIPAPDRPIISFLNLEGASLAILAEHFTQAELMHYIVSGIRHEDPRIRQKSIDQFLRYIKDIMTVNGRIGRAVVSQQESPDGKTTLTHRVSGQLLGTRPDAGAAVPGARILQPRPEAYGPGKPESPPEPRPEDRVQPDPPECDDDGVGDADDLG